MSTAWHDDESDFELVVLRRTAEDTHTADCVTLLREEVVGTTDAAADTLATAGAEHAHAA